MKKVTLRARFYRYVFRSLIGFLFYRWFSRERQHQSISFFKDLRLVSASVPNEECLAWFHAASEGELECLWSLILEWAKEKRPLIVTVFSSSAFRSLLRLEKEIASHSGVLIYFGASPWEGEWEQILNKFKPTVFVTAKYEAWPDLWMSLSQLKIPLVLVGAKLRSSLKICKRLLGLLGMKLPNLYLLTSENTDIETLQILFEGAYVKNLGEPRWDRVRARSLSSNARVEELIKRFEHFPRPWGMLGQVWKEDLCVWKDHLLKAVGTIWLAPHRVDSHSVDDVIQFLRGMNQKWVQTSQPLHPSSGSVRFVLLDEMGVLSELYRYMDWAFIGGGFGRGVHSTIEPAIHGIPLAAGSVGAEKFSEIRQLINTGQLTVVSGANLNECSQDLAKWLEKSINITREQKQEWRKQSQDHFGATQRIKDLIEEVVRCSSMFT